MYFVPQPHACPKCGGQVYYADNSGGCFEVLSAPDGKPFCPYCFKEWMAEHIPAMEPNPPG